MPRASGIFGSVGLHVAALVVLRTAAARHDPTPEARLPIEIVTAPAPESPPTATVQPEPESVTPTRARPPSRHAATVRPRPAAAPTPGEAAPGPGESSEPPLLDGTLTSGNVAMGSGGGGGHGVGGGGGRVATAGGGGGPPVAAKVQIVCDEAAMQALFPAAARGEGILEMVVPVRVDIGADGTVSEAAAVRDPGHGFGAAAETAVRRHCRVQGSGKAQAVTLRVRFVQN